MARVTVTTDDGEEVRTTEVYVVPELPDTAFGLTLQDAVIRALLTEQQEDRNATP